jgi:soluble lytic murein transglycosylase-like protein
MIRPVSLAASLCVAAVLVVPALAQPRDNNGNLDALISKHAAANGIPESLVRRVIHRESRGNPRAISKGNYGLMQIRLNTARGLGYRGDAHGLLDADTNMTYAVRYLANAYKVAGGNPDRAVHLYAAGYYFAAKRKGLHGIIADSNANPPAENQAKSLANVYASADPSTPIAPVDAMMRGTTGPQP